MKKREEQPSEAAVGFNLAVRAADLAWKRERKQADEAHSEAYVQAAEHYHTAYEVAQKVYCEAMEQERARVRLL